ncbi:MAG: dUTP diphosphatase [Chloroflexi bacterium]|nr:dUTP diphosphatase [Chloroflexota bacterium]
MILKVQLIAINAKIPVRMTPGSAGFDLYSSENMVVPPSRIAQDGLVDIGRALVPTGIKIELPPGTVGRIASRSGLSINSNIETGAGWVDSDYRGELKIELKNLSSKPYTIKCGDRIAQLVILTLADIEITNSSSLNETSRNSGGFGSTGK